MEVARCLYAADPATTEDDEGLVREISADEFIDCPSKAVMSIVEENTAFEELGIHVAEMCCTDPDYEVAAKQTNPRKCLPMRTPKMRRTNSTSGTRVRICAAGPTENSPS